MALRIAGGLYRSRLLKTPQGAATRPTSAMVREAAFNLLQGELPGSRVLDLFAGSGAMGLEALSRGAESAVFCDKNRGAVQAIRENVAALKVEGQASVLHMGWEQSLKRLGGEDSRFDLVFLDPPYRMDPAPVFFALLYEQLLSPKGIILLEQSGDAAGELMEPFKTLKDRCYGNTRLRLITLQEQ